MIWRLTVQHNQERRPWNYIYNTRKEALVQGKLFDDDGYKRIKTDNEFLLKSDQYLIVKEQSFYDGA